MFKPGCPCLNWSKAGGGPGSPFGPCNPVLPGRPGTPENITKWTPAPWLARILHLSVLEAQTRPEI